MNGEKYTLAAALADRSVYTYINRHIVEPDLTEQGRLVWKAVGDYYDRDANAEYVDPGLLAALIETEVQNPKHRETLRNVVEALAGVDVSPENWAQHLLDMRKEAVGSALATAILNGDAAADLVAEFQSLEDASFDEDEDEVPVFGAKIDDMFSEDINEDLIRMAPASLNSRLDGGLLRGHHVIVYARPEMGKTSFIANAVSGFLRQGLRVLYLSNEEPRADVMLRFKGRLADRTKFETLADREGTDALCVERGWDNCGMIQIEPGSPAEIDALTKKYQPDVLIVDQLRNIQVKGSKSDGFVQHLEHAAKAVRQIGIRNNCLVISVTQAGDSATGKAVLEMSDVADSKTGIPAQADVMIGIGATQEDKDHSRRVLSLPKNKRSGRHDFFPVQLNEATAKITNLD